MRLPAGREPNCEVQVWLEKEILHEDASGRVRSDHETVELRQKRGVIGGNGRRRNPHDFLRVFGGVLDTLRSCGMRVEETRLPFLTEHQLCLTLQRVKELRKPHRIPAGLCHHFHPNTIRFPLLVTAVWCEKGSAGE